MNTFYNFSALDITGQSVPMTEYRDKVVLIVNTASQCGFTPQYQELAALYNTYKQQGLVILAFPCNQFGQQEPADNVEIADFCQSQYQISFPLFAKIDVNGSNSHPLFQYLKTSAPGVLGSKNIKWNFTKFLIDRQGKVFKRYGSLIPPASIKADIVKLIGNEYS